MDKNIRNKYKCSGIYKITNSINGKIYIGSSINIYRRYTEHKRDLLNNKHINSYLQRSFNKYGKKAFKFKYIELNVDKKDLLHKERQYILKYNTINRKFGYNLTLPEDEDNIRTFSDESKEKIRRKILADRCGITTEEQYRQWKLIKYRVKGPASKPKEIVVLDKNTGNFLYKYNTISEASRELNISDKRISDVINGRKKHFKGFVFVQSSEYDESKDYSITKKVYRHSKDYYQFDINGVLIKKHNKKSMVADGFVYSTVLCNIRDKSLNNGLYYWSTNNHL